MFTLDTLRNRLVIQGKLRAETALRVGSSRSIADVAGSDLPVLRDSDGSIRIPGSSIKGALRSWCEAYLRGWVDSSAVACIPTGSPAGWCLPPGKDYEIQRVVDSSCLACQTFGSAWMASHLRVREAPNLQQGGQAHQVEKRSCSPLNRKTMTVGNLFDFETVLAGTQFAFQAELIESEPWQRYLLWRSLRPFVESQGILGGFSARGLGRMALQDSHLTWSELTSDNWLHFLVGEGTEVTAIDLLEYRQNLLDKLKQLLPAQASASTPGQGEVPRIAGLDHRLLNELLITITTRPGPLLRRAGEAHADPVRPQMPFVRTWRDGIETVYLPGSSLRGALRSHCEKIIRGFQPTVGAGQGACDPSAKDSSCSSRLGGHNQVMDNPYGESCYACQLFGNTILAGRLLISDAFPTNDEPLTLRDRTSVGIHRVTRAPRTGALFQAEVQERGGFATTIYLRNFTLAQLALLGLALRDLATEDQGWEFGRYTLHGDVSSVEFRMPTLLLEQNELKRLDGLAVCSDAQLVGLGSFQDARKPPPSGKEFQPVGLPSGVNWQLDAWGEPVLRPSPDQWKSIWANCLPAWTETLNPKPSAPCAVSLHSPAHPAQGGE